MAKYSFEFKKKIIEEYFSGEGGFEFLAKKYAIPYSSIRNCHVIEVVGEGVDGEDIAFGLKVVSACFHCIHHDFFFIQLFLGVVDDENALLVEAPCHAAGSALAASIKRLLSAKPK